MSVDIPAQTKRLVELTEVGGGRPFHALRRMGPIKGRRDPILAQTTSISAHTGPARRNS